MKNMNVQSWTIGAAICIVGLAACYPSSVCAAVMHVTEDTFIDARSDTANYGSANGIKVFVNRIDPEPTHALIALPPALASIHVSDLAGVKLWVYNYGFASLSRPIELHPLTSSFTEAGATWSTSDGTTSWATPGGDYSANHVDVAAPVADMWYAFDITSMMTGGARADLLNHGLLLKIFDDTVPPATTTGQNFVSSDNTSYLDFHPYFEVITIPEPYTDVLMVIATVALMCKPPRRAKTS
ncbi:MAG: DNRLRE domain-containing protein [Pirellulales bacterium]|nr:DNRLRE domain-containing protein [Pirellulales bacterium]